MAIEAVVLDIGNVLIEWQPERFYDSVIGEAGRKRLFSDIDLHAMNDDIDRGGAFRPAVEAMAVRHPQHAEAIMLWHDRWAEMAAPAIPRSVRIQRALRARGVPVFALTNFGRETFAIAEPIYPFLSDFDRRYISGHLGVVKPDPRIYQIVENDSGVSPSGLLFADDRAENIAAASARGWQTHLFTSDTGWADRLVAEGLLTESEAA
jgi:2-haloacid dehalogenase